ncbi:MAG: hypothetical protein A2008_13625 [Candidatus Wallbacteria bacterium GWC2_49_35]|uniref:Secretin/TonB short N-terminal domain-containing protein n=1 Tax=Candidatus Wallbacteria bacterium GWC2_49_35 TaxID=1817813 RepID=A0A1F7WQK4_9BACT|nr:MAG: hypothetical protein A2008_13625 [Candidatus Wallbacteria bacterium GWC2_49_35]HBC74165.1 hypothetical protein [Candidatus Wallbacteria bacterium]
MAKYKFLMILFTIAFVIMRFPCAGKAFEIECEDSPLREVLKIFADELDVNILADPKVADIKVNVSMKDVEAEDALDLILKMNGLAFNQETSNTYTVFRAADSAKYMSANTYVFKIGYAEPERIAESLRLFFPGVSFVSDKAKGTLFASGPFSDHDLGVMKAKIKQLDSKSLRIRVNYEILKIANDHVIESVLKLYKSHGGFVKNARAELNDIRSRSRSVTKANITLTPSEKESSIENVTTVPYPIAGPDGSFGVAESKAGDMFGVRAVSASEEGAVLDISVDTGHFIGPARPGFPPSSYSQRLTSVISVKNGERVLIGALSNGGLVKIISFTEDKIAPSSGGHENIPRESVTNIVNTISSGGEDYFIYLEAAIE